MAKKIFSKLRELITVYQENLHHASELQKQINNKGIKFQSYASSDKVWMNSKYIKIKQN